MSFIIENDSATDTAGNPMPSRIGPFLFRAEAHRWGEANLRNGSWMVGPVQSPNSLRRDS